MEVNVNQNQANEKKLTSWNIHTAPTRVDSFNFNEFQQATTSLISEGHKRVAFNFSKTQFLSLVSIKFLSEVAEQLAHSGGKLAIVGATEKLKRQMSIYASLETMCVVSREDKLP